MTDTDERIAEQVEERLLGRGMFLQLLDEWDNVITAKQLRDGEDVVFTDLSVGTIVNAMRVMFNGHVLHTAKGSQFPKIRIAEAGMTVSCSNPKGYMDELIASRTDGNGNVILQSASGDDISISWENGANRVFKL